MWLVPVILIATVSFFALALMWLRSRFPLDASDLVEKIDQLLPQTQCAQCGYPGCRPYAEAVSEGEAINLCPPGGTPLVDKLAEVMGHEQVPTAPAEPDQVVAFIDESRCIGCTLCLPPCPVDAILGAQNKMHTVINAQCTGCELCVPACPVDCIELRPAPAPDLAFIRTPRKVRLGDKATPAQSAPKTPRPCIQCGECDTACPIDLPALALLDSIQHGDLPRAEHQGLAHCIECELCDRKCPSDIPLAEIFANAKIELATHHAEQATKAVFKQRFDAHNLRLAEAAKEASDKREQRLSRTDRWS